MGKEKIFTHKTLTNKIADYLREQIFIGVYNSGDRLIESKISNEFNVSRAPVREAIKILEGDGLVESISRKGTFIVEFNEEEIREIYNIRVLLEMRVYKILINNDILTQNDYNKLEKIIEEMAIIADSDKNINEKIISIYNRDIEFHSFLCTKSNSKLVKKMLTTLYYQFKLAIVKDYKKENNIKRAILKHKKIINGLKNNSIIDTKKALLNHINIFNNIY